ncbi:MAG: hypothetical protein L3J37_01610 [Rhodobacteraceae bacterium]|nr:hypothetical protein [Paracoccaceae bacterium]
MFSVLFRNFLKDEQAAVTVDWVVLTAALVAIAGGVVTIVQDGLNDSASSLSSGILASVSEALT